MSRFVLGFSPVLALVLFCGSAQATLLTNSSFETGDLTGWNASGTTDASGAPSVGAQDGSFALRTDANEGVTEVNQGAFGGGTGIIPAGPGDEFNFSGWFLTEQDLSTTGFTAGIFKIVFEDAAGNDLEPASVSIGQLGPAANPGAEAIPFLDASSALDTWIFAETQAVAPAGTASVQFLALNVAFGSGDTTMWFDNISAVQIPEPATVSILGLACGAFCLHLRRKRNA